MADVIVNPENQNAEELLNQGIRAFVLQDNATAVQALGKASELLVAKHQDDMHDSLGDVYLYYGKALLALSRQEAEPLGDAIPKEDTEGSEEEEDEEAENDANEEKDTGDDKPVTNGESSKDKKEEISNENSKAVDETAVTGDNKEKEESAETTDIQDSDEPTDLQVAWEVLELAKKIFTKRGTDGKKLLAETFSTLGEISLESENFATAIEDIKAGLEIQIEIFPKDSRKVAESYYNLGVAYTTNSQLKEASEAFTKSLEYLNNRVTNLEKQGDGEDEIQEIKELLPELMEKINDVKNYEKETIKKLAELTKEPEMAGKIVEAASTSKQATDISHLVKRKRKPEENEEESNPPKKLSQ